MIPVQMIIMFFLKTAIRCEITSAGGDLVNNNNGLSSNYYNIRTVVLWKILVVLVISKNRGIVDFLSAGGLLRMTSLNISSVL
jgi:hypothetical protein